MIIQTNMKALRLSPKLLQHSFVFLFHHAPSTTHLNCPALGNLTAATNGIFLDRYFSKLPAFMVFGLIIFIDYSDIAFRYGLFWAISISDCFKKICRLVQARTDSATVNCVYYCGPGSCPFSIININAKQLFKLTTEFLQRFL